MLGVMRFEILFAQFGQEAMRSGVVFSHIAGITDDIGGKNGSQSAFQAISPSFPRLTIMGRKIHAGGMTSAGPTPDNLDQKAIARCQ